MPLVMKRKGYGQVEPNHLSGIVTGQIYAQLPAHVKVGQTGAATIEQLEQGQFAKYDYEKLYDERKQSHKDFVYKIEDFTDKKLFPRLIRTYVGDIMTTNTIAVPNTSDSVEVGTVSLTKGDYLTVGANGFLAKASGNGMPASGMVWKVVKEYTMPDGQPGVKIQRVQ